MNSIQNSDQYEPHLSWGMIFLSEQTGSETSSWLDYMEHFQSDWSFIQIICIHVIVADVEEVSSSSSSSIACLEQQVKTLLKPTGASSDTAGYTMWQTDKAPKCWLYKGS